MKIIQCTNLSVQIKVDDDDYELLSTFNWQVNYHKTSISVSSTIDGKSVNMARLIMGVSDPKIDVDHWDGDVFNDQKSNLRLCTRSQNNCNARKRKVKCDSQYKGVCFHKPTGKWRAQVYLKGHQKYLGLFTTEIEAAEAYNRAALKYYGEFAKLNAL